MKNLGLIFTWLGTALWTVAGTSSAIALDGPYNHPATDSDLPAWTAVWVTVIGILILLSVGALSGGGPQARLTLGTVVFVVFNTPLFLLLMLLLALGNSGGWSTG